MSWELALLNAFATWKGLKALPGVAHWAEGRTNLCASAADRSSIALSQPPPGVRKP